MQLNLRQAQPTRLTVRRTSFPASVGCGRSDHARSRSCTLQRRAVGLGLGLGLGLGFGFGFALT